MTAADILDVLLKANLASGAAILGVAALRKTARSRFGARLAYGLWLLPVLAGAAVLLPARQVVVVRAEPILSAAFRIGQSLGAPSAATVAAGPRGLDGPALLVGLWLAGVAGAALVMAVLQHRFIARARRGGVGPALVGLIAPRILIPRDFAERYSASEQALVLAHERAHLARQDSRLNGLVAAAQCLCWFNPLTHLAAHLMRVDQELACDEAVVSRFPDARRAYAEVLMKAQLAVMPLPVGCYWPSRAQHPLVERVAMLKRPRIGRARWRAGAVALGCLWAGAGLGAWASQPAQVRTVFRAAPVAEEPSEARPSDAKADDAVPDDAIGPRAAQASPGRPAAFALAEAAPPPRDIPLARPVMPAIIQHVVIRGAERVDQATILSELAIGSGDSVTVETLNAAEAALVNTGLFSDVRVQGPPAGASGDLDVWVTEYPLVDQVKFQGNASLRDVQLREVMVEWPGAVFTQANLARDADSIAGLYRRLGWPNAKASFKVVPLPKNRVDLTVTVDEGAKGQGGDASPAPLRMTADQSFHDEAHHIEIFKGNVAVAAGNGSWRTASDLLIVPSVPPDEPGVPGAREITWEGHVSVDHGDDAARADYAYYDFDSKTLTLTGHVAVDRGRWVVTNDRLVIDAQGLWRLIP